MTAPRCDGCRFWLADEASRDPADDTWGFGQCRRRPPKLIESLVKQLMPLPSYHEQIEPEMSVVGLMPASLCPSTHSGDWCGAFRPAARAAKKGAAA